MLHLHYTTAVTVIALREWTSGDRSGKVLKVKVGEDTREYPISPDAGVLPHVGEVVGLILEAYWWRSPEVSKRTGNAYDRYDIKCRVLGFFDAAKATLPKYEAPAAVAA